MSVETRTVVEIGSLITRTAGIKHGSPHIAGTGVLVRTIARYSQEGLFTVHRPPSSVIWPPASGFWFQVPRSARPWSHAPCQGPSASVHRG